MNTKEYAFNRINGPIVEVAIRFPANSVSLRKWRITSMKARLLIDTGSPSTYISTAIASKFHLPLGRTINGVAASGKITKLKTYGADIYFPDLDELCTGRSLVQFKRKNNYIDGLLGRDLLYSGNFTLNGPKATFTLSVCCPDDQDFEPDPLLP